MPEINAPAYLQGGSHTAQNDRLVIGGLYGVNTPGGVLDGFDLAPAAGGIAVEVGAGLAVVGNPATWGGPYHVASDSPVTVTGAPADAGNPRIDLLVARVYDSAYAGSEDRWALELVPGTVAPNPVAPTVPDRALVLAEVDVAAGAPSLDPGNINDVRTGPPSGGGGHLAGFVPLDGSAAMTGRLQMGLNRIVDLADPVAAADAANRRYVDGGWTHVNRTVAQSGSQILNATGLPSDATYLQVVMQGPCTQVDDLLIRFNGDTAASYRGYSWTNGWTTPATEAESSTYFPVISEVRIGVMITAMIRTSSRTIIGDAMGHTSSSQNLQRSLFGGLYVPGGPVQSIRLRAVTGELAAGMTIDVWASKGGA